MDHVKLYHDDTAIKCNICSKQCQSKKSLQDHLRSHKQVKCDRCQKLFKKNYLKYHQLHYCQLVPPPLEVIQSKECSMEGCHFVAETSEDLRKHLKRHRRKQESHLCSFCDMRFLAKKDLKAHMKTHAKYKCNKCSKSFQKQQTLGKHRAKCHASVSITNSCGWFMAVNDKGPEVIPMKKYHHCKISH